MNPLPTIRTERLVLRPFLAADAAAVQRLAGDREVAAMAGGNIPHPYPDGAAEQWIAGHEREFREGRRLTLAIAQDEAGVLGNVSLMNLSGQHRRGELGYWVGRPYWSMGYCTEAVRAVVDFGFRTLALNRIEGRCFRRNIRSARVLEKAGFMAEGCLRESVYSRWGCYEDMLIFGLLKADGVRRPAFRVGCLGEGGH